MIVQEHFNVNGRDFIRTYSDAGRYVIGGVPEQAYAEATDPADLNRQYVEGEKVESDELLAETEEIMNILLGVSE